jgi:Cdc6-like AAA superfamily ATPase
MRKLVLLASARALAGNRAAVTATELYQYYRLVCEEMDFESRGYTHFWENPPAAPRPRLPPSQYT